MFKIFNWKYKYFKKKLRGIECMIADLEFKREKTLMIREEVRREYDNLKQKRDLIQTKPTSSEADIKTIEDQIVLITRDIDRYEEQMKGMDLDVYGSKPTADYPNGIEGVEHQLNSLQELKFMVINYIKRI